MRLLIAGVSTRAAAASAARAGFDVTAIDGFADLDQHEGVRAISLRRDSGARFTAHAAANAARTIDGDAVAYLSNFENHPSAVATLAAGRALWGNPPDVLGRVRDPRIVGEALRRRGCAVPEMGSASARSLVKPVASGGGHGVREWHAGDEVPENFYLQEFIDGTAGSVVFVAARGRTVPLGVTRQLIGEDAFGSSGFAYCGNILAPVGGGQFSDKLVDAACGLARVVTEEFDLVGVNGIDFIARGDVPYAIEVNPRWCSSMELVERAYGVSVFGAHASACAAGTLPRFDLAGAPHGIGALGKAIVFAQQDVVVGDTNEWLADDTVHDVPHAGERVAAGRPVCTVYAAGANAAECYTGLVARADRVYRDLGAWRS